MRRRFAAVRRVRACSRRDYGLHCIGWPDACHFVGGGGCCYSRWPADSGGQLPDDLERFPDVLLGVEL